MAQRKQKPSPSPGVMDFTGFRNVDVDVFSRQDVTPLIVELGDKIHVNFLGVIRGRHEAHFDLAASYRRRKNQKYSFLSTACDVNLDAVIQGIVELIDSLPKPARKLWDAASARHLNVGIQAGMAAGYSEFPIKNQTLQGVASINAQIVLTIYPPDCNQA